MHVRWLAAACLLLAACFEPVGDGRGRRDAGARDGGKIILDATSPEPDAVGDTIAPDIGTGDAGLEGCATLACDDAGRCAAVPSPGGTVCRPAVGECDVEETCNGVLLNCPPNRLAPKATFCGNVAWCTGASAVCPAGSGEWKVFPNDRWYWNNPLPQGHWLAGLWGSGPNDVWAVGDNGTILHWDGSAWRQVESGTLERLLGIWGAAADDVWAVGYSGTILHWDGTAWTAIESPTTEMLTDVWGSGPNDVWTIAFTGEVLRWDGAAWTVSMVGANAEMVAGSGPGDVWLGPSKHWDGATWKAIPFDGWANDLWSAGPTDAWACGPGGLSHWDGTKWTLTGAVDANVVLLGLWGSSATDVWAVGRENRKNAPAGWWAPAPGNVALHWDGTRWTRFDTGSEPNLRAVWGAGRDDVWAAGWSGGLLHWDGERWTEASRGPRLNLLTTVWGTGPTEVWAGGQSYRAEWGLVEPFDHPLFRWDGFRWAPATWNQPDWPVNIQGSGPDDLWVVGWSPGGSGKTVLYRWDGAEWTSEPWEKGLLVTGKDDVWATFNSKDPPVSVRVEHWDGTSWATVLDSSRPLGLYGSGPANIWAVSDEGDVHRWGGTSWSSLPPAPVQPQALRTWAPDGAWLLTDGDSSPDCSYALWDGFSWTCHAANNSDWIGTPMAGDIWGDQREAWAIGHSGVDANGLDRGVLNRWDGQTWKETAWRGPELTKFWGTSASDVWVVGEEGIILRRK